MAEHLGDIDDLIQQSLLNMGNHELDNLAQILAFDCRIQLETLREMMESSEEAERIIEYVDCLSTEQKIWLLATLYTIYSTVLKFHFDFLQISF